MCWFASGATTARIDRRGVDPSQSRIETNSGLKRPSPDSMIASPSSAALETAISFGSLAFCKNGIAGIRIL